MIDYTLDRGKMRASYKHWAQVYDAFFHAWLAPGRKAAVEQVLLGGPSVLDVGVGTGLALPLFPSHVAVTGVDLSEAMLRKAQEKVQRYDMSHVKGLSVMDATALTFADGVFDGVLAEYVVTIIPDAEKAMDELIRVVKPGGRVVIVNYFAADRGPRALVDHVYGLAVKHLGLTTRFPWSRMQAWLQKRPDVKLVAHQSVAPLNLFTLAVFERLAEENVVSISDFSQQTA